MQRQVEIAECLTGSGEMGRLMRAHDWSATPLGPAEDWPQSLRTAVSICLNSRFPIVLWWGPELRLLYNAAWRPVLGQTKHPQALGSPGREVWPEIWHIIGPMLEGVLTHGKATWSDDQLLPLDRNGYLEEAYFTYSYSPILGDGGKVGGVCAAVNETTQRVIGERRLKTLRGLAAQAATAKSAAEACRAAVATLAAKRSDVPFALLYRLTDDPKQARLCDGTGLAPGHPARPNVIGLADDSGSLWPLAAVIESGQMLVDLDSKFGELPTNSWPLPAQQAVLLRLMASGQDRAVGVRILGVSPRSPALSPRRPGAASGRTRRSRASPATRTGGRRSIWSRCPRGTPVGVTREAAALLRRYDERPMRRSRFPAAHPGRGRQPGLGQESCHDAQPHGK